VDEAWWAGEYNGQQGLFPSTLSLPPKIFPFSCSRNSLALSCLFILFELDFKLLSIPCYLGYNVSRPSPRVLIIRISHFAFLFGRRQANNRQLCHDGVSCHADPRERSQWGDYFDHQRGRDYSRKCLSGGLSFRGEGVGFLATCFTGILYVRSRESFRFFVYRIIKELGN
jgi:hypothetical protein